MENIPPQLHSGDDRGPKRARSKRSGSRRNVIILGTIVLLLVVVIASQFGNRSTPEGVRVTLDTVRARTIVETVTAPGVVQPENEVEIAPEISGEIVFLGVDEGERVSRGTLLVRIDADATLAERRQASAQVSTARSAEKGAQVAVDRARSELERIELLASKELASEQEREVAESQLRIAEAELEGARGRTAQARATLQRVSESLERTTITSPIDGVITRLAVKPGERVVGAMQMAGTRLMTVSDLSVLEVHVDVVESDVVDVEVGDPASVELDALPGESYHALVSHVGNAPIERPLGTSGDIASYRVRLRLLDPDVRIRPGMSASATITTGIAENVPSVPIEAVTIRRDTVRGTGIDGVTDTRLDRSTGMFRPFVFLFDDDHALPRGVEEGLRDDYFVQIRSGLAVGDIFVLGPYRAVSRDLDSGDVVYVERRSDTDDEPTDE